MGSGSGSALPLPALGDNGAASGDSESSARGYSGEIDAVDVVGVSASELAAAASMARYVQKRASEMTADKATHTLDERGRRHSRGGGQGRAAQHQDSRRPPWHAKRSIAGTTLTTGCLLYLSGEEDEVVRAAAEHAASVHGNQVLTLMSG